MNTIAQGNAFEEYHESLFDKRSHVQILENSLQSELSKVIHFSRQHVFDQFIGNSCIDDFKLAVPQVRIENQLNSQNYWGKSQNWIGVIEELLDDSFMAKLFDKKDDSTYEIGTFEFDEISDSDKQLIKTGAVFYWSVGYENRNGQISKQSLIRFKRSVGLDDKTIDEVADRARDLDNSIIWE